MNDDIGRGLEETLTALSWLEETFPAVGYLTKPLREETAKLLAAWQDTAPGASLAEASPLAGEPHDHPGLLSGRGVDHVHKGGQRHRSRREEQS